MSGKGTYVFPDHTKLTAIWINNEPERNYEYKDPLGHDWLGKLSLYKPVIVSYNLFLFYIFLKRTFITID